MSHETGSKHSTEKKHIVSFQSSFWLVVIIVGLFIAALNFIKAESGNEEEGKGSAEKTEMKANVPAGEQSGEKAEEMPQAAPAATDSAAKNAK